MLFPWYLPLPEEEATKPSAPSTDGSDVLEDIAKDSKAICPAKDDVGPWCDLCSKKLDCPHMNVPCPTCKRKVNKYDIDCWWCGYKIGGKV